jgi:hypothetical protein
MRGQRFPNKPTTVIVALTMGLCALIASSSAMALNAPGWELSSHSYPTNLHPGSSASVAVVVYNVGAASSTAGAVLTDRLPAGVEGVSEGPWSCSGSPSMCSREVPALIPGEREEYLLKVNVGENLSGSVANQVAITGGGALNPTSVEEQLTVSSTPAGFGLAKADAWYTNSDGTIDTQAGSHPYEFTFSFEVNSDANAGPEGEVRGLRVDLPRGLIGNPTAVPRCKRQLFDEEKCPTGSQIGTLFPGIGGFLPPFAFADPVYNLVPPPGHPAEFGFEIFNNRVLLDASVRSDGDYGITETVNNIPQREIVWSTVEIWGVPADPSHDAQRVCFNPVTGINETPCKSPEGPVPFLTMPTACEGPQSYSVSANEWLDESVTDQTSFLSRDENGSPLGLSGCEHLGFAPSISVAPDTSNADTPAGLTVEVHARQDGLEDANGVAISNIKDTTVTLPEGVVINPGQAAGLGACQMGESGVGTQGPPACPSNSKVGTDEIETPLLNNSLKGGVYVLQSNPPNLKLLVAASGEGVNLKLVGDVHLDEATGRLTTTFKETPEFPFTTFRLSFSGGAQAALDTPTGCGTFSTTSDFTPWSSPFVQDVFPTSAFVINHGSGGSACPSGVLPFTPSLIAGATTDQAGGFTNFSLLLTRPDDQQRISSLRFVAPQGLTGMLSRVPLCTNAQAETNTCPEASKIGHTMVESGPGPYPLVVPESGQPPAPIYLTESYGGAPFGLSIVVPLHVGPFVLPTQRVRAKIEIDPETSQLAVTTDPLPQVVAGVPTDLRAVDAVIEHPEFMINPTNCDPQAFSGTANGAPPPGAGGPSVSAAIGSHFQVGACQALKFTPKFAVTTSGKTSKANGASLNVKLSFPNLPQGSESNIRTVKVDLPKQLPSRLTTLQKACTEQQFSTNPAGCPAASVIGHATAITPILPVPLTGPAYFVSHGGAKFPELIMVLQGYGITIDLHGETFISKAGVTSSTFHAVPDQPVSSFELNLPQGPYSALAANGNLCTSKLTAPNEFVGQNGAAFSQNTPVAVTGCPKARALTRAQKLALALKACKKKPKGAKRNACQRQARRKYGPIKKAKKSKK